MHRDMLTSIEKRVKPLYARPLIADGHALGMETRCEIEILPRNV